MKTKEKPAPPASDSLKLDVKKTLAKLEEFLSRKLEESGFNGYIIGLSGGIDTSVTAAIAVRAVGASRVQSICMPYKAAQTQAARDARLVATWLGIKHAEVELWRVIDAYYSNIKAINPVRTGNKMARERMAILFDQSFDARLLVLGATNRSEMALGYATWFGETACSINLLGQLYKTQVRQLAVELEVPEKIRLKPPSGDLWLGHTDEDELGITFDELDRFLSMVIDQGILSREKLKKAGFSDLTIDRTLAVSHKFYFKRRCPETADLGLPDIPDNITLKKANRLPHATESGTLYLVPTPIGNLEDLTPRAKRILSECAVIACEDTRVTAKLFGLVDVKSGRLVSYHDFNESERAPLLVSVLLSGSDVAVVTDAGSPGVSDPAYRVITAAIAAGARIVALPGANSVIPALTASGLPTDRFFFEGFLPNAPGQRRKRLREFADFPHTLVFFESPHRIIATLIDAREELGERPACVAREISKLHEEYLRGSLTELVERLRRTPPRGEIVLVIAGKERGKKVKVNKYRRDT